jgi:hypothetical protein
MFVKRKFNYHNTTLNIYILLFFNLNLLIYETFGPKVTLIYWDLELISSLLRKSNLVISMGYLNLISNHDPRPFSLVDQIPYLTLT